MQGIPEYVCAGKALCNKKKGKQQNRVLGGECRRGRILVQIFPGDAGPPRKFWEDCAGG
jgi:hypothetical protein